MRPTKHPTGIPWHWTTSILAGIQATVTGMRHGNRYMRRPVTFKWKRPIVPGHRSTLPLRYSVLMWHGWQIAFECGNGYQGQGCMPHTRRLMGHTWHLGRLLISMGKDFAEEVKLNGIPAVGSKARAAARKMREEMTITSDHLSSRYN